MNQNLLEVKMQMSGLRISSHVYHFSAFCSNNPCADAEREHCGQLWDKGGRKQTDFLAVSGHFEQMIRDT